MAGTVEWAILILTTVLVVLVFGGVPGYLLGYRQGAKERATKDKEDLTWWR